MPTSSLASLAWQSSLLVCYMPLAFRACQNRQLREPVQIYLAPMRVVLLAAFAGVAGALQRLAPRTAPARSVSSPTALRSAVVSAVDRTNWETSGRDLILKSEDGTSDIVFDAEHAPAGGDPAAIVFFSAQIKYRGASPHPAAES